MTDSKFIISRWFEDIPVGEFHVLGAHTFSEKEIVDFGQKYAPEIHHTQPELALDTFYRGIVASEWHVVAIWMRLMVDYMERYATVIQDGRRNGAGVGLKDMQWLQVVRPGHTLTYTYEIIAKPDRVVRNKWGIICSDNKAFNHHNELVFSFIINILAEKKPQH